MIGWLECRAGTKQRVAHRARVGMGVHAAWRGRGVGGALLDAAIGWATAHPGVERLTLGVAAGNSGAIRLYESRGFVQEGRLARELRVGPGRYEDELLMARRICKSPGSCQ